MAGYSRGSAQVRYNMNEETGTAGQSRGGRATPRHGRTRERLRGGWRRRAGATGVLLAVIAVTMVIGG
ncbi:hypothetical protein [Pseudoduganella umbonata]|uniref:Uncharacterized protein n=2 Tax=Pseudoduganella umbonata TaxID=864828 RepID=A0A4P8HN36_9BURK|nr:hypothetical protein [Pseudoduganella umbonata]MBB3219744.1 hypothetical protein [Pseudoduganella umbonata]QCP09788.1 hypothetical protein FCL38_04660 [Pseudoduganella umbonata]